MSLSGPGVHVPKARPKIPRETGEAGGGEGRQDCNRLTEHMYSDTRSLQMASYKPSHTAKICCMRKEAVT